MLWNSFSQLVVAIQQPNAKAFSFSKGAVKSSILGPWIVGFSYVREKVALVVCLAKARIFCAGERSGSSETAAAESFSKEQIQPVKYDEDGGYVYLEVRPCAGCGKLLCAGCGQFHCDACRDRFCIDHLVSVPDGTPTPCTAARRAVRLWCAYFSPVSAASEPCYIRGARTRSEAWPEP